MLRSALIALSLAASPVPAAAADAPWSKPARVAAWATTVTARNGDTLLLGATRAALRGSLLRGDGTFGAATKVGPPLALDASAAVGRRGIAVGGLARRGLVLLTGTARGGLRRVALPGVRFRRPFFAGLAGNRKGDLIVLVGGGGTLVVTVRRADGAFSEPVQVADRASFADVAIGGDGEALVTYQRGRAAYARAVSRDGALGAPQRLFGFRAGGQPLDAEIAPDGTAVVAGGDQVVDEGDALTPFVARASVRPPQVTRFGPPQVLGRVARRGTGRYVSPPGVRVVTSGRRTTAAYVAGSGGRYVVRVRDLAGVRFGRAQTVSPAGRHAVLAGFAGTPRGDQALLWRLDIAGADPAAASLDGPIRLGAAVRRAGSARFGPVETVTRRGYADDAELLMRPTDGRAVALWRDVSTERLLAAARTPLGRRR